MCAITVRYYCALLLCAITVRYYCALLLCVITVRYYCALLLCAIIRIILKVLVDGVEMIHLYQPHSTPT